MKLNFSKIAGRLGVETLSLFGLMLSPLVVLGTQSIYINTGIIAYYSDLYANTVSYLPNIDATNFYNSGIWDVYTEFPEYDYELGVSAPYKTAHTLNYTNVSTMTGSEGWEFDYGPSTGGNPSSRGMSASFFNGIHGRIEAVDGDILNPWYNNAFNPSLVSALLISATNLINQGILIAGAGGQIVLNGAYVNLARGTLEIGAITPQGSANGQTNFIPDTAIYDELWQQTNTFPNSTTLYTLDSSNIWNGSTATSPVFYYDSLCLVSNEPAQLEFVASWADSTNIVSAMYMTNIVSTNKDQSLTTNMLPTQIFRQAVFVGVSDPNISPNDTFYANADTVSNLFRTITVRLSSAGGTVYLEDTLGSSTNRGLLVNEEGNVGNNPLSPCTDPTYRPANYVLSRLDPGTFANGSPGLGPPATNFLYDPSFTNIVVQATYAGYGAYLDDLVRHALDAALTNLPGQIVINATNLDLTMATITSEGAEIVIQANNFIGSTGAVVSCQNLSYNLGSAVGNLNVTNLVNNSPLPGLNGNLYAWSGLWTNGMNMLITNYNTNGILVPLTNSVEMNFHVLLVDGAELSSVVPVTVQNLILNSTNMVVSDSMTVTNEMLFNGQSLTLQGVLNLSGNLQDWNSFITPTWLYFTNNGTLTVPQDAHFGDDGPTNYAAFVNNGSISVGGSETINSDFYQCSGHDTAPGGYFVTTPSGKLENAGINSGQDMDFTGGFLKLNNSTLSAGNQFNFTLTNALYDSGGSANNTLTCGAGFNLWVKPPTGDLLGTAITSEAFNGAEVDYVWAGVDRGATNNAGYTNNVALGTLLLSPVGTSRYPALFYFSSPDPTNAYALYVDLLNLSQITNLTEMLGTDPNFVIYYAAAKLPPAITVLNSNGVPQQEVETNNPLNGQNYYVIANGGSGQIPQEAEEALNGQLNGHLRWVNSFAGPNSSVDVIIMVNGQPVTFSVNKALRYSLIIDSNTNGIPNGLDPYPFSTPPAGSVPQLTLTVSLTPLPGQSSTNSAQSQPIPSSPPVAALSWLAAPNTVYQVQYSTNLAPGGWQPLLNYTNTASTNVAVMVWDTNAVSGQRFYRLSHP